MSQVTERLSAALADRYRIERHLGAGGMATVYLAHDLKHDRKVAVKVLKPELAAVLGAERFVVEIRTTAALQHPHILPLFDSGTADSFLFYVMPFIEGETLRDKLNRETQLGVDEALRIATDVADALDYAHRHGVIHRDIKPENILLHDGRPMVADFGIALAVSAAAGGRMTETGLSLGTPHYMSPEQATAEKDITARSDVYSLASVLYEMLAGQPPHLGGSAQQIIMRIITDAARPVTELRKAVPAHVAAAVAKALEKLPADRFATAKEFRDALMNPTYAGAAGTHATTGYAAFGNGRKATRRELIAWALVGVATIAGVAAWLRPEPEPLVGRFAIPLADSALLSTVNASRIALSPNGQQIVFAAGDGADSRLWVRSLDALEPRVLAGTEYAANPTFSPDGRRIAFVAVRSPRTLNVVGVAGGPVLTLTDSLVDLGGVSWGTDGYIYFDGHLEGDGVARIRADGGESPEIASTPNSSASESYHFQPDALPDGRGFLFTIMRGSVSSADIAVRDARTGEHKVLARGIRGRYSPTGHLLWITADGQLMAARFDLRRLELTGEPVLMTNGIAVRGNQRVDISVSAAGDLLYVAGETLAGQREFIWVSRAGARTLADPATRWVGDVNGRISLSPEGRRVAFTIGSGAGRQVWVKELGDGPAVRVTESGWSADWTHDGRNLLFTRNDTVHVAPADGSSPPRPLGAEGVSVTQTPDGAWIVYSRRANVRARRTSGDTSEVTIADENGGQILPQLSPDGRWVAYTSDETGNWHVYVRPFPNASASRRQVSVTAGYAPFWSRDGRELFFVTTDSLYVSAVTTGATFTSGNPRGLFGVADLPVASTPPDISRDGSRFLVARAMGSSETGPVDKLVLVQNFASELRAKVPE
jgi:Tol biopolymer transport system component